MTWTQVIVISSIVIINMIVITICDTTIIREIIKLRKIIQFIVEELEELRRMK